jgi:prepilin-type N-terminal cleavage/methylation domain-containing protein
MHRSKAYSLIEVVLTLSIISILAAIAGPRYLNSLTQYHASAAANRIAGDLNLARWQARISSGGQTVIYSVGTNSYSLPGVSGLPGQPSPYSVLLASDPYDAALQTAAFGGSSTMSYDRFGQPAAGGTVTVQCGAFIKTVVVDPNTGLASVQ